MTVEEYLALEETASLRHEFLDGQIWAMSRGTFAHDRLSMRIAAELDFALRGSPCGANGPNLRIKSERTGLYTYADALVVCTPRFEDSKRTTLLNPRVVVEVLSENTEWYDRSDKFAHYQTIESIQDYVLISTTTKRVEVYSRNDKGWLLCSYIEAKSLEIPSVDVRIALSTLYADIPLDPPRSAAQIRTMIERLRADPGALDADTLSRLAREPPTRIATARKPVKTTLLNESLPRARRFEGLRD